jgi:cob(I)alamin adenosyltransferase
MPKLTRIYTRTGDDGTTGLVGGQRVKKNALRIESYGTIDELSSVVGLARTALAEVQRTRPVQDAARANAVAARLDGWLAWTQDVLFNVGSDLATLPQDRWEGMPLVVAGDALALERAIDEAQRDLAPLANFIHPGGAYAGAFLHQARTVCRRAERLLHQPAIRRALRLVALDQPCPGATRAPLATEDRAAARAAGLSLALPLGLGNDSRRSDGNVHRVKFAGLCTRTKVLLWGDAHNGQELAVKKLNPTLRKHVGRVSVHWNALAG